MSSAKAREYYQSLTPQQKQFVDNKTISTTLSVKHWLAFLGKAAAFDEFGDKVASRSGKVIGCMIPILVLSIIASLILKTVEEIFTPLYAYAAAGVSLIILVWQIIRRRHYKKKDISNYLRLFIIPFMEVMKVKAGEEAKLSASFDLRNPLTSLIPEKYVDTTTIKKKVKLFEPKVMLAKISLLDGAYLETVLMDEIRVLRYWKRGTSGKMKLKTKHKTTHNFFIKLTVPRSRYSIRSGASEGPIEISESEEEITLKFKGKHKEQFNSILPVSVYFSGLQAIYNRLNDAHAPDAQTSESVPSDTVPIENSSLIPAMVWTGAYFNNYDYDSTRYRSDPNLVIHDDVSTSNVFDS